MFIRLFKLIFCQHGNNPSPQPSPRGEGVVVGEERTLQLRVRGNKKVAFTLSCKSFSSNPLTALLRSHLSRFSQTKFRSLAAHSYGFTLAEVLITLAILGVVAAILIPNTIKKIEERQIITKAKQTYAQIENAWNIYQVIHSCKGETCIGDQDNKFCNNNIENIFLENMNIKEHSKYLSSNLPNFVPTDTKNIDGTDARVKLNRWGNCNFLLKNGVVMSVLRNPTYTPEKGDSYNYFNIIFDVNGKKSQINMAKTHLLLAVTQMGK